MNRLNHKNGRNGLTRFLVWPLISLFMAVASQGQQDSNLLELVRGQDRESVVSALQTITSSLELFQKNYYGLITLCKNLPDASGVEFGAEQPWLGPAKLTQRQEILLMTADAMRKFRHEQKASVIYRAFVNELDATLESRSATLRINRAFAFYLLARTVFDPDARIIPETDKDTIKTMAITLLDDEDPAVRMAAAYPLRQLAFQSEAENSSTRELFEARAKSFQQTDPKWSAFLTSIVREIGTIARCITESEYRSMEEANDAELVKIIRYGEIGPADIAVEILARDKDRLNRNTQELLGALQDSKVDAYVMTQLGRGVYCTGNPGEKMRVDAVITFASDCLKKHNSPRSESQCVTLLTSLLTVSGDGESYGMEDILTVLSEVLCDSGISLESRNVVLKKVLDLYRHSKASHERLDAMFPAFERCAKLPLSDASEDGRVFQRLLKAALILTEVRKAEIACDVEEDAYSQANKRNATDDELEAMQPKLREARTALHDKEEEFYAALNVRE